jgi:hypothetical protein
MRNYKEIRHLFQGSLEVMKHQVYRYNETKSRVFSMEESNMSMLEEDQTICPCVKCMLFISLKMHRNIHHE